jgi:hypothetical protein
MFVPFVSMFIAWLRMPDVAVTFAPVYMSFFLPASGVLPVVRVDVINIVYYCVRKSPPLVPILS